MIQGYCKPNLFQVDPSAEDCEALRWAKEKNHSEIVELLLSDPRVSASSHDVEISALVDSLHLVKVKA